MKAFENGITKSEFMTEIRKHQEMDAFIRGTYGEEDGDTFRGCAVGCSLKSVSKIKNIAINTGDHGLFETHLGIPRWLARLEDTLFENISRERIKTWPVDFAEAINQGADLSKIIVPMLIFIVESAREKTNNERSLSAIDGVLNELKKHSIDYDLLRKAHAAAAAAAAAAYAAAAAAADAAAYAAADAAAAAADAAAYAAADAASYAAAYAAADAADAAASRVNQYNIFADKLLELIRECK